MSTNNGPIVSHGPAVPPLVGGAALNVGAAADLALLDVSGLTLGTRVYVTTLDTFFALKVSSASVDHTTVEAVAGWSTGYRWVSDGVTFPVSVAHGGTGAVTASAGLDALTAQGADVASATSTPIGAATGKFVNVTGTVTITSFDTVAAGIERVVRFTGALLLTYNGTSLILPGAANITTAANDTAVFVSLGSGNWRCLRYSRSVVPYNADASALNTGVVALAQGGTGQATANLSINALQNLTLGQSITVALADNVTATAPVATVQSHTSSGAPAASFGVSSAVDLHSSTNVLRRAMTDETSWLVATNAAEQAKRKISIMVAGTLTEAGGFVVDGSLYPMLYVGTTGSGLRSIVSQTRLDVMLNDAPQCIFLTSGAWFATRVQENRTGNLASATTLTIANTGNVVPVTGTVTVNGIVTTNWQTGARITLELASGITITHNSGAPGASAVAIQLRAGSNLVTSGVYFLDLIYNGTFWYQPG